MKAGESVESIFLLEDGEVSMVEGLVEGVRMAILKPWKEFRVKPSSYGD